MFQRMADPSPSARPLGREDLFRLMIVEVSQTAFFDASGATKANNEYFAVPREDETSTMIPVCPLKIRQFGYLSIGGSLQSERLNVGAIDPPLALKPAVKAPHERAP